MNKICLFLFFSFCAFDLSAQVRFFKKYDNEGYMFPNYLKVSEDRIYAGFYLNGNETYSLINPDNGAVTRLTYVITDSIPNPPRKGAIRKSGNKIPCCITQGKIFFPALYYYVGTNSLYTSGIFCFDTSGAFIKAKEIKFNYPSGSFRQIEPSLDGNLYAIGSLATDTTASALTLTGLVCKLDTAGNKLWEYWRVGPYANILGGLVAMPDSGMATVVTAGGYPDQNKAYLLRLSKTGQKIWEKPLPLPTGLWDGAELIDYDEENGEYLVYQNYASNGSSVDTQYLIKVDTSMNIKWQWAYRTKSGNIGYNGLRGIVKDRKGYIAVGAGNELTGSMSVGLLKFDEKGNKLWTAIYDSRKRGGQIDSCEFVVISGINIMPDGGYILSGSLFFDSIPTNNRTAFIMRIDSNGCFSTDSCESREWNAVITYYDAPKPKVSVFPNPVADALHIGIEGVNDSKELSVSITNILGETVMRVPMEEMQTTLSLRELNSGVYFYSIQKSSLVLKNGKMVKE